VEEAKSCVLGRDPLRRREWDSTKMAKVQVGYEPEGMIRFGFR
jgi:hypothetical protein